MRFHKRQHNRSHRRPLRLNQQVTYFHTSEGYTLEVDDLGTAANHIIMNGRDSYFPTLVEYLNILRDVDDVPMVISGIETRVFFNLLIKWYRIGCPGHLSETELQFSGTKGLVDFSVYDTGDIRITCQNYQITGTLPFYIDVRESSIYLTGNSELAAKQARLVVDAVVNSKI